MAYKKYNDHYLNNDRPERADAFQETSAEYRQDGQITTPVPVITAVAERWLAVRGFTEEELRNGEQEGMYRIYLRDQVRDALARNGISIGTENFLVIARGCHGEGEQMQPATFRFQYQLDCEHELLSLKQLEVTMSGTTTRYRMNRYDELPHVSECYEQIELQRSLPIDKRLKIAREIVTAPQPEKMRRLSPLKRK